MNSNPAQLKTNEKLRASHSRAGFASAVMLCAVMLLLVICADILSLGLHSHGFTVLTSFYISVRYSAYAGLTKGFFEINEKLKVIPWDNNSLPEITNQMCSIAPEKYAVKVSQRIKMSH